MKPTTKDRETDRWNFIASQIFNYSGDSDFWAPNSYEIKLGDMPHGFEHDNRADTRLGKRNRKNTGNAPRKRSHVDQ